MKRGFVRGLARCLAGVLFLAQMAVAAYACPGLSSAIDAGTRAGQMQPMTQASAAALQVDTSSDPGAAATAAQMPNCGDMAGAIDPDSANLCAEHCKYGQQSDHAPTLTVPVAILNALYTTPVLPLTPLPRSTAALAGVLVAASVPHTILHCVFRI